MSKTIAVDFDGVLHPYTNGWTGPTPEDEPPMEGAAEFLEWCKAQDYRVVVYSARAASEEGLEGILAWLDKYDLAADQVTATKPAAIAYVDDRAVHVAAPEHWYGAVEEIIRLGSSENVRPKIEPMALRPLTPPTLAWLADPPERCAVSFAQLMSLDKHQAIPVYDGFILRTDPMVRYRVRHWTERTSSVICERDRRDTVCADCGEGRGTHWDIRGRMSKHHLWRPAIGDEGPGPDSAASSDPPQAAPQP